MSTVAHLQLGPADRHRPLSPEEYLDAEYRSGFRYELARGVLEVTRIPRESPHGLIVWYLYTALALYSRDHPGAIHRSGGAGEYHIWLPGMASGRNPDVAVTLVGTPKDAEENRPPSLAMEVVSRGIRARRRDYEAKREEYLAYGLREYWIVDPFERKVTVLVRDGDSWDERTFVGEQAAEGLVLPGFRVPLPELWAAGQDEGGEAPAAP
jgi:Uma2 family endonuclease